MPEDSMDSAPRTVEEYKARKKKQEAETPEKRSIWHFPELIREQRIDLFERLDTGAEWNFSFGLLTVLSTVIASFGLILSSPAVVIGAMVVAPLMLPLIAAGLSLVQGNIVLFRTSAKTMLRGATLALLASFAIGLLIPQSDISGEILARAAPNILDLLVAFFAGFAAAYAVALPELLGALAGVAISVALVPPIATTGISIADGAWGVAYGAGLLFVTNLAAIVLGAATVYRCFGLYRDDARAAPDWVKKAILTLSLFLLLLGGLLGHRLMTQLSIGQSRPLSYPLTPHLIGNIEEYLDNHRNIRFVIGGRKVNPNGDSQIFLFLSANRAVQRDFKDLLTKRVHKLIGTEMEVQIHIFQEVAGTEATSYAADADGIKEAE